MIYAADSVGGPDISNNRIDRFDGRYQSRGSFTDPQVPAQYPGNTVFQVENVNGKLFVTFAGFTPPFGGGVTLRPHAPQLVDPPLSWRAQTEPVACSTCNPTISRTSSSLT
jgi:hypothetical protein